MRGVRIDKYRRRFCREKPDARYFEVGVQGGARRDTAAQPVYVRPAGHYLEMLLKVTLSATRPYD